jgi:hypothetical protein
MYTKMYKEPEIYKNVVFAQNNGITCKKTLGIID